MGIPSFESFLQKLASGLASSRGETHARLGGGFVRHHPVHVEIDASVVCVSAWSSYGNELHGIEGVRSSVNVHEEK